MELRRETFVGSVVLPGGERATPTTVEERVDPLTGHTTRLVTGPTLLPDTGPDVATAVAAARDGCPFCPGTIEHATPRFPPEVWPDGRIRVGDAVTFPNLLAYSQHSCVTVYSPDLHDLPLAALRALLLRDNVAAALTWFRAVRRADPAAAWVSLNANHLPPSGSSVYHPHTQGSVHPRPTTVQRGLADVPASAYAEFLALERRSGERYLARTGRVEWLTAFAPVAPAEFRAFVPGVTSPEQLDGATVDELAHGIAAVLAVYAELGASSFNLACYGAPETYAGYPLNLRIACRSGLSAYYRSDAMFLERLHWTAATGISPEQLAERARTRFG